MANEKEVLSSEGDKISSSPQSSADQSKTSSANALADKEVDELKKSYSESSREAKRLAAREKELSEILEEKTQIIEQLNEYIDSFESKAEISEVKEEAKVEQEVKPVRPNLTREEIKNLVRENFEKEKLLDKQASQELIDAEKEFPALSKKIFRGRVFDKIKGDSTLNIKEACQKVVDDIEAERAENEEGEPFVESGTGAKGSQSQVEEEDDLIKHLTEDNYTGFLP